MSSVLLEFYSGKLRANWLRLWWRWWVLLSSSTWTVMSVCGENYFKGYDHTPWDTTWDGFREVAEMWEAYKVVRSVCGLSAPSLNCRPCDVEWCKDKLSLKFLRTWLNRNTNRYWPVSPNKTKKIGFAFSERLILLLNYQTKGQTRKKGWINSIRHTHNSTTKPTMS